MAHKHSPECQFYFVPEAFMALDDYSAKMPQWDDKYVICLDDPTVQNNLLSTFLELAVLKKGKLSLIGAMDAALAWINKFGAPFPLETRLVRYPITADACDLGAMVSISGWLNDLLRFHRMTGRANFSALSKLATVNLIVANDDYLQQFCDEVRRNHLGLNETVDESLIAAWACYTNFREPKKYVDGAGNETNIRRDRRSVNRYIATAGDKTVQRYSLLEFGKESLHSQEFVAHTNRNLKSGPRGRYSVPRLQKRFLKKFDVRKSNYNSRLSLSFAKLDAVPLPLKGQRVMLTLSPLRVDANRWETARNDVLLESANEWFLNCVSGLLKSINPKLKGHAGDYTQYYELLFPWQAIVLAFVRRVSTRKPIWRICPSCGLDMSFLKSSAKACSEACSKRIRRKQSAKTKQSL